MPSPGRLHANYFYTPDLGSTCSFQVAVSLLGDEKTGALRRETLAGDLSGTRRSLAAASPAHGPHRSPGLPCVSDSSCTKSTAKSRLLISTSSQTVWNRLAH